MIEIDIAPLMRPRPPWVLWHVSESPAALTTRLLFSGCAWRSLAGSSMRTTDELFAEFHMALSFPEYFGRNWNALEDCLRDLAWWPAQAYVLVVTDASEILAAEASSEFSLMLRILRSVASQWAEPVDLPDGSRRPATPFHVVFQVAPEEAPKAYARVSALDAAAQFGVLA